MNAKSEEPKAFTILIPEPRVQSYIKIKDVNEAKVQNEEVVQGKYINDNNKAASIL